MVFRKFLSNRNNEDKRKNEQASILRGANIGHHQNTYI